MTNTEEILPAAKKARIETTNNPVETLKLDAAATAAIDSIETDEDNINKLIDEQSEAIIKLEQEYVAKLTPIYAKRSEDIKKISNFWSRAFTNHPILAQLIDEQDEQVLESLKEIKVNLVNKDIENPNGSPKVKTLNYAVHFMFAENDYFEDKEIVKSFYQLGDHIVSQTVPDKIAWKPNKNLIELTSPPKSAGDDEDEVTASTFFTWFGDHDDAEHDEIGEHIREDLWPHALNYYLNEIEESEDELAEVDLEEEEEEEVEEEVEEEEETAE